MARFRENILRPEEEFGGFEPSAEQDETFLLERLPTYPGELSNYMPDTPEPEEEVFPDSIAAPEEQPAPPIQAVVQESVDGIGNIIDDGDILFDDDFIASLRREVTEAEDRKAQQEVGDFIGFQGSEPTQKNEFSLDNESGAQIFDLGDIEAIHPSSYGLYVEENAVPEPENVLVIPAVAEENVVHETVVGNTTKEVRKKRSLLPWLIAAILLLALGGGGGWWFLNYREAAPQITEKKDSLHVTTENGVAPEIVLDTTRDFALKSDSLKADSLKNVTSKNDSLKIISLQVDSLKNISRQSPVKVNPDTVSRSLTVKPKKTTPRNNGRNNEKEPLLKRSENGLYVVQVYSSPSRDDADDWVGRLRERNAGNAVVTSQKIRGQQWYRVRFGSYQTRAEAESAALKLGFAQSWVVQIR